MLHLFRRHSRAPRARIRPAAPWRGNPRRRPAAWEPLEARTLLATLNIASGALTFTSGAGIADTLLIKTTGSTGRYTVSDSATTITLGAGAIAAGWSGSGTNTVTGPDPSVTSIAVDTRNGNDAVTVQSVDAPVTLTFTNMAGNVDTVTVGGDPSKGAQAVNGSVAVTNVNGTTILVVDDSADTKAVTVSLSSTKITGLVPGTDSSGQPNKIDFAQAKLDSFTYDEGVGGTTLTISSTARAPVPSTIHTGLGVTSVNTTTVQGVAGPLTIDARGTDTVTLGAVPQGMQNLAASVSLMTSGPGSIAVLNLDDSADLVGRTATISSTTITGLAPSTIDDSAAAIIALNIKGGQGGNRFTVASLPDAIVTLGTGAGAAIDPSNPAPNTVHVQDTTDPANADLLNINAQGLDTINLDPSAGINVTGSTRLLTPTRPAPRSILSC